jgi:hypothetical protein
MQNVIPLMFNTIFFVYVNFMAFGFIGSTLKYMFCMMQISVKVFSIPGHLVTISVKV